MVIRKLNQNTSKKNYTLHRKVKNLTKLYSRIET